MRQKRERGWKGSGGGKGRQGKCNKDKLKFDVFAILEARVRH